jgi:hypothetical protein
MRCFYHHDAEAIAICKSCSRGVCADCAADVPPGTACINRCEKDVEALNVVMQRAQNAYQKTGNAYRRNAIATLIAGLVFLSTGLLPIIVNGNYGASFVAVLGFVFLLWAYFSYKNAKQIESPSGDAQQSAAGDVPKARA